MIDFAGWSMPLLYRGILEEHRHTRSACSVFDVSHMGRLVVRGPDAEPLLQYLCTRDLAGMPPGVSRYSHMCREDGGILDDVIVSRFEDNFLVVCNGANREKIVAWLHKHADGQNVELEDRTLSTAMVAIQGPQAIPQLERLLNLSLTDLKRYHFREQMYMTFRFTMCRSGYTGEDGVELVLPVNLVKLALPALLGLGDESDPIVRPAGLGARDSLRLEAGMPLYGHELTEDWDSLTASQGWCVQLDQKEFIGAGAMRRLKAAGLRRRIVGLELEGRRTARQGFKVLAGGDDVGFVTSGVLSPTLEKSIAMAMVDAPHNTAGAEVAIDFGGKTTPAWVVKLPFYKRTE
jgi:aminomethyltransferase